MLVYFLASVVLSWALTGLLVRALSGAPHRAQPNHRSMHLHPTPVGGGLAIIATLSIALSVWFWPLPRDVLTLMVCAIGLCLFSAGDHYWPLWPITRIAAHVLAVAIMVSLMPENHRFAASVPLWLERTVLAIAWLWLINLTNFMDGIDGIAGAEGAAVALGVVSVFLWPLARDGSPEVAVGLSLAGACLGYLVWNWSPAKVFMGDAGSIPLGFLLGWLLIGLAANGAWAAALALPVLFVADATVTLARRCLNGATLWVPHRSHFYQRAVVGSASPTRVVAVMTACNCVIILLALQSMDRPVVSLTAAAGLAALFLCLLSGWSTPVEAQPEGLSAFAGILE